MFTKPRKNQATMTQTDVYIPVDAIKGAQYFILCKSDLSPINQLLEQKQNVYVLTPQELEKAIKDAEDKAWTEGWCAGNNKTEEIRIAIGDAFDAGIKYEAQSLFEIIDGKSPNKEQYLNNLKP